MADRDDAPEIAPGTALRPEYQWSSRDRSRAGMVFVIQDRAGQKYILTAAHVLFGEVNGQSVNHWTTVRNVILRTLDEPGQEMGRSTEKAIFIGSDDIIKGPDELDDHTFDMVIRPMSADCMAATLRLAADIHVDEPAWIVGRDRKQDAGQHLYPGKIILVGHGIYRIKLRQPIDLRGFSGGPVINRHGEVIGNVIDGDDDLAEGAPVTGIRRRLEENRIEL